MPSVSTWPTTVFSFNHICSWFLAFPPYVSCLVAILWFCDLESGLLVPVLDPGRVGHNTFSVSVDSPRAVHIPHLFDDLGWVFTQEDFPVVYVQIIVLQGSEHCYPQLWCEYKEVPCWGHSHWPLLYRGNT